MIHRILITLSISLSCTATLQAATDAENLAKKPDSWFHSKEGRRTIDNILSWQSVNGDWPKNEDTTSRAYPNSRAKIRGTFDNGATTGELRVLARAFRVVENAKYKKAFHKGFDHIIDAQYANGGWPQYFPLRKGYYSRITFNDGSMIRLMQFLRDSTESTDFAFLDDDRRARAMKALERGVDCILKCQVVVNSTPTVWCAQHDELTFAPAIARSYELASLSGSESVGVLKYLMSLEDPTPEIVSAVTAGVNWFDSVKIRGVRITNRRGDRVLVKAPDAPPLWARFYEIGTNRPFFCDRDGIPKYDIAEIGEERRNGYAWYGNWGESLARAYANWPHRQ